MYNGTPKPATPPDMQSGDNVTVKVVTSSDAQSIVSRRSALRASLTLQVNAMFIKNLHFQKRRKWANCCLCALPLFFILILVALQIIINNLLTNSGNFTCPDDPTTASNSQRSWCAIPSPSTYPPLLKMSATFRAPNAILYTGTNSDALAGSMTPSDTDIDAALATTKWNTLRTMLWTGLNASCNINSFITQSDLNSILETDCAATGGMTDPATGQAPKEFSATQWSRKAQGLTSSPSPQIKLMIPKLTGYPGGLDAFAACASKGLSAIGYPSLIAYAPQLETKLPMGSFAPLGSRLYEDPAFAPLFLQPSTASFDAGRFGNVAFLASNCSLLSTAAKCYMGTVGVTQGIYSTCFSTSPKNVGSVSDLQSTLYNSYFNRLKGGVDAIKQ